MGILPIVREPLHCSAAPLPPPVSDLQCRVELDRCVLYRLKFRALSCDMNDVTNQNKQHNVNAKRTKNFVEKI